MHLRIILLHILHISLRFVLFFINQAHLDLQKIAFMKTFEQTCHIGVFFWFRLGKICVPTGISRMDGKRKQSE